MVEKSTFENSLRRSQNKEISFSAFSVEGCGEEPIKNWKEISLFWVPSEARQRGAPNSNAYAEVCITTRSARCRLVQSLRDWSKKVRATVITSPRAPKRTRKGSFCLCKRESKGFEKSFWRSRNEMLFVPYRSDRVA